MNHAVFPFNPQPIRQQWLVWTVATLVGFLVSLFWVEIGERPDLGTLQGILGGAAIGLAQALILGRWLPHAWLWMLATLIAWGLMAGSGVGAMGWVAPRTELLSVRLMSGAIFGAMSGMWLGVWQWLVLKQCLSQAGWWIGISTLGWSLALATGWGLGGMLRSRSHLFLAEAIGLSATWLVVGMATGIGMGCLLRYNWGRHSAKINSLKEG